MVALALRLFTCEDMVTYLPLLIQVKLFCAHVCNAAFAHRPPLRVGPDSDYLKINHIEWVRGDFNLFLKDAIIPLVTQGPSPVDLISQVLFTCPFNVE